MKKVTNVTEVENMNTVTTTAPAAATEAAAYVKPAIEVIEMEMEGAILSASDGGRDGGYYGR